METNTPQNLSLSFYRMAMGLLLTLIAVRYFYNGWIDELFIAPSYHFHYFGLSWWKPLPPFGMYGVFFSLILFGIFFALNIFPKISAWTLLVGFTYIEFLDKATYLNHYYLITLVLFLFALFPTKSLTDKRVLNVFRLQIALVYIFAGVAKFNYEWVVLGQPLAIWFKDIFTALSIPQDYQVPLARAIGVFTGIFELSLPFFLSRPTTRFGAYMVALVFHISTYFCFNIGVFPLIMMISATLFFDPKWPSILGSKFCNFFLNNPHIKSLRIKPALYTSILIPFFSFQIFLATRHFFIDGQLFWHERGFNFSWHVMAVEKAGYLRYLIKTPGLEPKWVYPSDTLSDLQSKMIGMRPDMIIQFAHHIADVHPKGTQVFAESFISINGRPAERYFDLNANLLERPVPW
ncbi:MAG: hypothetical protein CL677_01660 [Bdellovibrionaceae bacterium]|nr:hypothetical protein [Pseudobdellovibrionaceae bacterium]|tara:strand:+ start:113361 stop:114575 length:1215 start_codon:yes stop_codon:yes gene_type:complete